MATTYPVRVDATLDPEVSRWLWLLKWMLVVPHLVVLAFLWIGFIVASAVAFLAILVTGRYPPSLFAFNVGVLRWSWRVSYYAYGALGTDRYPPFTLAEVPDYPAHLDIAYPPTLSRGLVLVKWWLLALPHYLVVGIFAGGGTLAAWQLDGHALRGAPGGGLIGLLVLIAAVVLAFTGRYPQQLFDFVLGLNRWVLRVAAYAGLLTDAYPPFRLDLGGHEPSGRLRVVAAAPVEAAAVRQGRSAGRGWTAGRIVAVVAGSVLAVASLAVLAAGGVALWADQTQRDASGFLTSGTHELATGTAAITSDQLRFGSGGDLFPPADLLGTVRVRAAAVRPARPVFLGLATRRSATAYLSRVDHVVVTGWRDGSPVYRARPGSATAPPPAAAGIWTAQVSGAGRQVLTFTPRAGTWTVVVMNADGRPGILVEADAGATVPDLGGIAAGLLVAGAVLLGLGVVLITVPVMRAGRTTTSPMTGEARHGTREEP